MRVFVDSNIPMYVAGREHPNKQAATQFLQDVRAGEVTACTSTEVLQEILYRYCALKRRDLAERVYSLFVDVCSDVLPVTLADKRLLKRRRDPCAVKHCFQVIDNDACQFFQLRRL